MEQSHYHEAEMDPQDRETYLEPPIGQQPIPKITLADRNNFDQSHPELARFKSFIFGTCGTCIAGFPVDAEQAYEHIFGSSDSNSNGCERCQHVVRRKIELLQTYENQESCN